MGRGKERDGLSPAEAFRKQQRKKELEKNRRQREAAREVKALQHADTASVRAELVRLQQLDRTGQLDNAHRGVVNRVAELYQKKLIESPNGAAAGAASSAPAPKKMRPAGPPAPAPAPRPTVTTPSPVAPTPTAATAPAAPTGPTEIVLGTGGLMPTSLRVRRNVKKCAAPAPQAPAPPPPAPQTEKAPSEATDEMARFEEEMKQLGAL